MYWTDAWRRIVDGEVERQVAAALVEEAMQREPGRLDPSDRCAVLL